MEDFKNGMEDIFPYQFHTRLVGFMHGVYRRIYRDTVVINNILTDVFNQSTSILLFVDKSQYFQTLIMLHGYCVNSVSCMYCTIADSKHIAICSIDTVADSFDSFNLYIFSF